MQNYQNRVEAVLVNRAILAQKYRVENCIYDKTALTVQCTEKEFERICRELKCSGIYSEKAKTAIVTNFGYYK